MTRPLVMLPGMMCDARLFAHQIADLSRSRPVIVPPISRHDTMAALAADVLAQAPPVFDLAGLSMGGIVAMEVMAQAPHRVAHLALMDTNPWAEAPERQVLRQDEIDRALAGGLPGIMRDEMKPRYLAPGPGRPGVLDLCMTMALDLGPQVFARQSRALRSRPDRQETLQGVRIPTLILCGAKDGLCPPERHKLMHDLIPGSDLVIVPNAGHLPPLEQPDATLAALRCWLGLS